MLHEAWDSGRCDDAMVSVLGDGVRAIIAAKTVKTRCGKRVAASKVSNGSPTCADCLAFLEDESQRHAWFAEYQRVAEAQGFDAAHDWANAHAGGRLVS